MSRFSYRVRERGFALLIVLWTVALLSMLATQLAAAGRGEAQLARNIRDSAVAEAAADGAVYEAVFHALDSSARHWPADGVVRQLRSAGATIALQIDNEAGKVNLNIAPPELLAALLHAAGVETGRAASIASAIADWRFVDAQRVGSKADAYRAAGRSAGPPHAPFQSIEELGLVLGMTPGLLARLTPYLTLFHDGQPNPLAAAPLVRQAILEAAGGVAEAPAAPDETVIAITARATTAGGARFARHSVVKLGQRKAGGLFQILTWDTAP